MTNKLRVKINVCELAFRGAKLVSACRRDREELEALGRLAWEQVMHLSELVDRCMKLDAEYNINKGDLAIATLKLKAFALECLSVRNHITDELRRAARLFSGSVSVPSFEHKPLRHILVFELYFLYVLCRDYEHELRRTGFNLQLGSRAYEYSSRLSLDLANSAIDKDESSAKLINRNINALELYNSIKEICSLGRLVFRKDPRKKDYFSGRPKKGSSTRT